MEVVIWLFSKNLTVQSGLNICVHSTGGWPLSGNTSTLAHDTLQGISSNNSLENSDKDPKHLFSPAGAIKHVKYTCKKVCTLCNRYLGVCYVLRHLSNCIPVACIYSSLGHFLVCESAGSGL